MALPRRLVPAIGETVTVLGLGAWAMGGTGWSGQDDERSIAAIRRACHHGVGWIDTAGVYGDGHAEELIGRTLRAVPAAERPLVFTKGGLRVDRATGRVRRALDPAALRADCDASLRRLGVERLDLFQLHWPADDGTPAEESWATMAELRREGKVRWLGASNFGADLLERCRLVGPVDFVQPPLSLLRRAAAADVIPWARAHGAAVIVYSPLQSGLLAGRLTAAAIARLPPDDWRPRRPEFREPELGRALELVERLRPLAARLGCAPAELAIAWVLAWPGVTGAIIGARDAAQVDALVGAAGLRLGAAELDEVADALRSTGAGEGPLRPVL